MIDGVTDGTPPLDDEAAHERWVQVCTAAYDSVRADRSEVLRPYAGTNPAEFFAVATEVFFNRPGAPAHPRTRALRRTRGVLPPGSRRAPHAIVKGHFDRTPVHRFNRHAARVGTVPGGAFRVGSVRGGAVPGGALPGGRIPWGARSMEVPW